MENTQLDSHFNYWDDLVREWLHDEKCGVSYMPEPWWGWTPRDGGLHSVTINLSPGAGGRLQMRPCILCAMERGKCENSYSRAMAGTTLREHLPETEKWHLNRRYKPLMEAIGLSDKIVEDTRHHLSIELSPYHPEASTSKSAQNYEPDITEHVLKFAARAAKEITSPLGEQEISPLKNRVIVRATLSAILKFAREDIELASKPNEEIEGFKISTFRLKDKELSDVLFICFTGACNHLPGKDKLCTILKHINNQKNIK